MRTSFLSFTQGIISTGKLLVLKLFILHKPKTQHHSGSGANWLLSDALCPLHAQGFVQSPWHTITLPISSFLACWAG